MNECLSDFLNKISFEDPRLFDFSEKTIDIKLRKVLLSLKLPIYNPDSINISCGYHDQNFTIISAHWSLSHFGRGKLKNLHQRFEVLADSILELNNG